MTTGYQPPADYDDDIDAKIDAYHAGWFTAKRGTRRPHNVDAQQGWDDYHAAKKVRVVMPERPEGYYHAPLGAFD